MKVIKFIFGFICFIRSLIKLAIAWIIKLFFLGLIAAAVLVFIHILNM